MRDQGPFDESEADLSLEGRIDFGGLLLQIPSGIEIQVQADQASGRITQLTLKDGNSGMQIHPYAARKSGGMWDEVRAQIKTSVNASGGLIEEVNGPWGTELHAQVKTAESDNGMQPARFVGIDGPRWFLRAVFLGQAARDNAASERLVDCLRTAVVVRGDNAMAPGTPLVLRLPQQASASQGSTNQPPATQGRPSVPNPFERGPEITETR